MQWIVLKFIIQFNIKVDEKRCEGYKLKMLLPFNVPAYHFSVFGFLGYQKNQKSCLYGFFQTSCKQSVEQMAFHLI